NNNSIIVGERWPGLGLLPRELLLRLRAENAPLFAHLLRVAATAVPEPFPRLCHPAERLLCSLLLSMLLSEAVAAETLRVPAAAAAAAAAPAPSFEVLLLRIWRRISLLQCTHCEEQRQAAMVSLGQVLGLA